MSFSTLFFDLDATLYPSSNGLWDEIRNRIYQYMREKLGLREADIPATQDHYWKTYGTTLEGLRIHHNVDPEDYLSYVHDVPYEQYLSKDPVLDSLLRDLPQNLWVFTNADQRHAQAVLAVLGIQDHFNGIIDLLAMNFLVKPIPDSYRIAQEVAGETDPARCVLFDDLVPNLQGAKNRGFTTVLVGDNGNSDCVDYQLPSIHQIKQVLPHLWNIP
jgi:putative hydrolase of the HAD superfamily